ncbi:MAG: hypothetical protein LBB85_10690 [Dysgonamonadaceae bacterium]|nr:hypothetical protein [Dysgonamonadaceae bacterium]
MNTDGNYALVILNATVSEKSFTVNDGAHTLSYKLPA